MTYSLFVLAACLFGYIVYAFYFSDARRPVSSDSPEADTANVETPSPVATTPVAPARRNRPVATEKPAAEASDSNPRRYRNPLSGEIAAMPTNYRFAKRWIREAMVHEGLLDRVYSNAELDDEIVRKTKTALEKFKQIEKYQVNPV
ncbi:MAG: hypothetical protein ACRESZ_13395 [Methylococcales bacterium]